jgi:hypothetical protein
MNFEILQVKTYLVEGEEALNSDFVFHINCNLFKRNKEKKQRKHITPDSNC